jgi:hypothetical protein
LEKINKIDKPLANLTKGGRKRTKINKIGDEKGNNTTNTNEIQRIIRKYIEKLYSSKLEIIEQTDKVIAIFDLLKLNQENINHLNRCIIVIKRVPTKKSPGTK